MITRNSVGDNFYCGVSFCSLLTKHSVGRGEYLATRTIYHVWTRSMSSHCKNNSQIYTTPLRKKARANNIAHVGTFQAHSSLVSSRPRMEFVRHTSSVPTRSGIRYSVRAILLAQSAILSLFFFRCDAHNFGAVRRILRTVTHSNTISFDALDAVALSICPGRSHTSQDGFDVFVPVGHGRLLVLLIPL